MAQAIDVDGVGNLEETGSTRHRYLTVLERSFLCFIIALLPACRPTILPSCHPVLVWIFVFRKASFVELRVYFCFVDSTTGFSLRHGKQD